MVLQTEIQPAVPYACHDCSDDPPGPCTRFTNRYALIRYMDTDENEDEEQWLCLETACCRGKHILPSRVRPFLSVWQDEQQRPSLHFSTYLRPGIEYSRPYLDKYTIQLEYTALVGKSFKDTRLVIRGSSDSETLCQHWITRKDMTGVGGGKCDTLDCQGVSCFMAMTCDDNGRIYALTRPCGRLVVITLRPDHNHMTISYLLRDLHVYGHNANRAFLMHIDDTSMVLYIQELKRADDGPEIVRTIAFALPLLPAVAPVLT